MQRTSQCLGVTLEAVSDHHTGSSFKCINMVLHQRDFETFSIFYRAQNICTWPTVRSGNCPLPTLGRKVVCLKKITGLLPGVWRYQMQRTSFRAALLIAKNSHSWQTVCYREEATSGVRKPGALRAKKANMPALD